MCIRDRVLVAANIVIAALRNLIPDRVRLPGEIVVVASMVTVVDMLMELSLIHI